MKFTLYDDIVGAGLCGYVFHGKYNDEMVAVKKSHSNYLASPPSMKSEARFLELLDHPNVIGFRGLFEDKHECYLIMELALGGTLQQYLGKDKFTLAQKQSIVQQICSGLEHMHSKGIVHRDIKPENLLFQDKQLTRLVITDFGQCRFYNENCDKPNDHFWVYDKYYTWKSEVKIVALVAFQVFEDSSYIDMVHTGDQIVKRASTKEGFNMRFVRDPKWRDALVASVSRNPEDRPTLAEFHKTFKQPI